MDTDIGIGPQMVYVLSMQYIVIVIDNTIKSYVSIAFFIHK